MKHALLSLLAATLLLASPSLSAHSTSASTDVAVVDNTARTVSESDSLTLVDFYIHTGGSNWYTKNNWLTGPVATWEGVTVEANRVTSLTLVGNNLSNTIPASIGNLTALKKLDLYYNELSGSIPESIGNLTALNHLNLANNFQLSGSIPASIGHLTALTYLDLTANRLSGSIPASIGHLTALTYLNLYENQLSGSIPASIGNLTALTYLHIYENQLSGSIPESIGNLTALTYLNLSSNDLSGSIPESIGNLTALQDLLIDDNQLTGNIPASIGNLTALKDLSLFDNQLSGSVPASIGNMTALDFIFVGRNQLTSLPTFINSNLHLSAMSNQLTFESLEPNISKFRYGSFAYAPQDSVGSAETVVLAEGQSFNLSVQVGGANNRYQWTRNGSDISGATNDNLTVTTGGTYSCKITNTVVTGLTLYRRNVYVRGGTTECTASGTILREYWDNVNGNETVKVPVNTPPTSTSYLTSFEAPSNIGDRYGSRVRGYICPPETGNYTFWIAADDYGDLYLSTDDNVANKQLIAYIKGYAAPRQWNKHFSQKSALIYLEKGKRYYIEALQKENFVNDNLAVAWRLPSATANSSPVIIPGSVLSPFVPGNARQEVAAEASIEYPLAAYPNPFTDQVTVSFTAKENGQAVLELYDMQGTRVGSLFEGFVQAGQPQTVEVKVSNWTKGLYLLQFRQGNYSQQLKLIRTQ